MLARRNGLEHQFTRQLIAANEFNNDIDFRVGDHCARVGHHLRGVAHHGFGLGHITARHHGHFDAASGAAFDLFLVAAQHFKNATTHIAQAQQANLDRFHKSVTL